MIRNILITFVALFFFCSITFGASFENYSKEERSDFEEFQKQNDIQKYNDHLKNEFVKYKDILEEEFSIYRSKILKHWDTAEVSDRTKWIEYSPDYRIKRIVDFKYGYIQINTTEDRTSTEFDKLVKNELKDLLVEDQNTSFNRNPVAKGVEKKLLRGNQENLIRDKVKKTPVLSTIFFKTHKPSSYEVKKAVTEIREKGEIKTTPKGSKKKIMSFRVPLPSDYMKTKARQFKPSVSRFAQRYDIESPFIFAVIHSESSFNPMAVSHVPAYGLMQIVPKTAGKDVTKFLYGKEKILAPSFLYNAENNINIGSAYLHILFYNYLKGIDNKESRFYCAVASYNTGVGNLALTFINKKDLSATVDVINKMNPDEVYNNLMKRLPYKETKDYLERVTQRTEIYKDL